MKTIFLIICSCFLFSRAFAGEVIVMELPAKALYLPVSSDFRINFELGRAWVESTIAAADSDSFPEDFRARVDGLTYSEADSAIVYANNGTQVVCANIVKKVRRYFPDSVSIRKTGNCRLRERTVVKSYDNGYEVSKYSVVQIIMVVNE